MLKTVKSQSFHEKTPFTPNKKPQAPLLEVLYDNPNSIKSTSMDPVSIPLENEGVNLFNKSNPPPEFKDMMENDKLLLSEPIFNELSPVPRYSKLNNCSICGSKFGLLSSRKNCAFCGEAVCSDHSEKKRGNPKNMSEFVKICDKCERKYLEKMIYDEFVLKKNHRNKAIFETERVLAKMKDEMMGKQKQIYMLMTQKEEYERLYREKLSRMNEKLKVVKKKIEEVEEGNRDLSTNIEKINLNIKSEEIKEYEYDSINLRMKNELNEKEQELLQIESQIKEIEGNIQGLEAQLSKQKFRNQELEYHEGRREQNDMLNSYIKSIMSEGQGSIVMSNPSFQMATNQKNGSFRKEKACLCAIF